ncbi:MAG: hypothetical protein QT02_C0008G0025 [archaeon GW2011_AR9]|nr:MAG: hypothetical protein QT02_C0008G0025 [archaeon GW2011_AR9]MBS3121006.1 nucleotidyltransferase domain-containing protein [Candidatus Woesearchaeota archaeon]HIG93779.1 nucleotidyltransferase domain-containing protein [Candidatus Woesearchaeota archaeon]HIH13510.1 nucleotidyltransferase domain-containing protein [Candidatus Woesearchaeota archaeon]
MNYKLVAYAADFVSFLIQELGKDAGKITQVVLFGSVARGEEGLRSDIDIFVDVVDLKLEESILMVRDRYFDSIKVKKYWELMGVKRKIHCTVGKLKEWDTLERSLVANGLILYGKFSGKMETKPYFLFILTPSKDRKKNVMVWRELYGYTQRVGKKVYKQKGLVNEYGGRKLGKGVFIVPLEHAQKVRSYIQMQKFKQEIIPFMQEVM